MVNNIGGYGNTFELNTYSKKTAEKNISGSSFVLPNATVAGTDDDKINNQPDSIMDMYRSICEKYPDVTFRLDDMAACTEYYDKNGQNAYPYMGYKGSMNQVGENFGEMQQKSVEIDRAVLERCMKDPNYKADFEFYLEDKISRYDMFRREAMQDGYTNICVGFSDEEGKLSMSVTQAHCKFSTEEEIKQQWSMQQNTAELVDKVNETKDEVLENYMQLLSEHSQKLKEQLMNNPVQKDESDWREMSDEAWNRLLAKTDKNHEKDDVNS